MSLAPKLRARWNNPMLPPISITVTTTLNRRPFLAG